MRSDSSNTGSYSYNLDSGKLVQRFYFFSDVEGQVPFHLDTDFQNPAIKSFITDLETNTLPLGIKTAEQEAAGDETSHSPSDTPTLPDGVSRSPSDTPTLPDGVGFCFLGDLVDHGPYSVQLLYNMTALKERYQNRVILVLGNRDLNKLRMADEQTILQKNRSHNGYKCIFCDKSVKTALLKGSFVSVVEAVHKLVKNKNTKFAVDRKQLLERASYLMGKDKAGQVIDEAEKEGPIDIDIVARLKFLYTKTFKAGGEIDQFYRLREFRVTNRETKQLSTLYSELVPSDPPNTKQLEKCSVALALLNMIMGNKWELKDILNDTILSDLDITTESGLTLDKINGLYPRYIANGNIIAKIQMDNKLYYASHHGVPGEISYITRCDPADNETMICDEVDQKRKQSRVSEYVLRDYHKNLWTDTVEETPIVDIFTIDGDGEFPCKDKEQKKIQKRLRKLRMILELSFSNKYSPVVTETTDKIEDDPKDLWDIPLQQQGGMMYVKRKRKKKVGANILVVEDPSGKSWRNGRKENRDIYDAVNAREYDGVQKITANIYGHMPQGLIGRVRQPTGGARDSTQWVCLDVSKADSTDASDSSFCVYKLTRGARNSMFGRFRINAQSGIHNIYDTGGDIVTELDNYPEYYVYDFPVPQDATKKKTVSQMDENGDHKECKLDYVGQVQGKSRDASSSDTEYKLYYNNAKDFGNEYGKIVQLVGGEETPISSMSSPSTASPRTSLSGSLASSTLSGSLASSTRSTRSASSGSTASSPQYHPPPKSYIPQGIDHRPYYISSQDLGFWKDKQPNNYWSETRPSPVTIRTAELQGYRLHIRCIPGTNRYSKECRRDYTKNIDPNTDEPYCEESRGRIQVKRMYYRFQKLCDAATRLHPESPEAVYRFVKKAQ